MSQTLGNISKGIVFIVSAPAGTGKTTLTQMLVNEYSCVVESISYTTRKIRGDEIDGVHYHFVARETFEQMIKNEEFLEYAEIYGEYYGTSKTWVEKKCNEGKHVVLVIDTQGALNLKNKIDAVFVFIMPPSIDALEQRLLNRKTDSRNSIAKRLEWAAKEIEIGKREYEYVVINDNLSVAYEVYKSIFVAEEHRAKHLKFQGD